MGIPKKSDEVVLRILQTLSKTKDIICPKPEGGHESENNEGVLKLVTIDEMNIKFENIERALKKVHDLLPNVKYWEEHLFDEFTDLEREIDGYSLEDDHLSDAFINKLQSVAENVKSLEAVISKLDVRSQDNRLMQEKKISDIKYPTKLDDWSNLKIGDRLMESREIRYLMASFEHLATPQSKMCALYYSIFPEDWVLNKRQMTYWWMAESWAAGKEGKSAAQVADDIFQDHFNQGVVDPYFKRKNSPVTKYFTVHPWIHRRLIAIAKEAELFDFGPNGVPKDAHHRLFLFQSDEKEPYLNNGNGNLNVALTSVINISRKYLNFKAVEISKWKKIVALQLGRWRSSPKHHIEVESEEFLKGLKKQKYLKYLGLRGISRITTLPSSITKLVSLEILDIRACHNLEKLPDMSPLSNLTHLDLSECYLVENMPNGIGKLYNLQVLKGFVIGKRKSSSKIGDLVNLKVLRKLSIYIGSKATYEQQQTELDMLKRIPSLRILTIVWALNSSTNGKSTEPASSGEVIPTTSDPESSKNGDVIPTSDPESSNNGEFVPTTSDPESSNGEVITTTSDPDSSRNGDVIPTSDPESSNNGEVVPTTSDPETSNNGEVLPTTSDQESSNREIISTISDPKSSKNGDVIITSDPESSNKGEVVPTSDQESSNGEVIPTTSDPESSTNGEVISTTSDPGSSKNGDVIPTSEEVVPTTSDPESLEIEEVISKTSDPECSRRGDEISPSDPKSANNEEDIPSILDPSSSANAAPLSLEQNSGKEGEAIPSTADKKTPAESAGSSMSLPKRLEKLDLRCVPQIDLPDWLNSDKLVELEKLYIRGGNLENLAWHGKKKWNIKILRLKYLKNLNVDESELRTMFPSTLHLEKTKCGGADVVKNYNGLIP